MTGYTFTTPTNHYELSVEERPGDEYDRYCVTATSNDGYDDWTSDPELRGALGKAVMRAVRHESLKVVTP